MPRVNVSISTKLLVDLDNYCTQAGDTRSGLISELIRKKIYAALSPSTSPKKWEESLPKPDLTKLCNFCDKPAIGTYRCFYYSFETGEDEKIKKLCFIHLKRAKKDSISVEEVIKL